MAKALKNYMPEMTLAQARAEVRRVWSKTCEAKYHGTAVDKFYSVGIMANDLDTELVFRLASQYLMMEIARSSKGREQQAAIDSRSAVPAQ